MARYALIITESGIVDNVIEYNGVNPFNPPPGMELREATDNAEIGGTWNGSAFVLGLLSIPSPSNRKMRPLVGVPFLPIGWYGPSGLYLSACWVT